MPSEGFGKMPVSCLMKKDTDLEIAKSEVNIGLA